VKKAGFVMAQAAYRCLRSSVMSRAGYLTGKEGRERKVFFRFPYSWAETVCSAE
jgi:hypothetical protein